MLLFKNRYRIKPTRLPHCDYSRPGRYFITICTKQKINFFGRIRDGQVEYSDMGFIAVHMWQTIPQLFDHVVLREFIIMPNHIHGIIQISHTSRNALIYHDSFSPKDTKRGGITGNHNPMINQNSISAIIRSFKARTTHAIHQHFPGVYFEWQPKFYDCIIRSEIQYINTARYIINNPQQWSIDHPKIP